ncbi:MAG: ABC transporter permease [Candidatus Limnocylindrales bacterium]
MERLTRGVSAYGWEFVLLGLLAGAVVLNTNISPWYLNVNQILNGLRFIMVPGLLALALAVIVLQGEIDISLPSQVAVGTVLFGFLASQGMPYVLAVLIVIAVGAMLGAFNGIVVTSFGLPSMAVTFGTLWAYRGLAFLLPDGEYGYASTAFTEDYFWIGGTKLWGTLPVGLVMLAATALLIGLLVHRTTYGRWTYAIGNNAQAARFSGIRVGLVKTGAYALGGVIAAFGALIFVGQYESARGDNMEGQLLFIVAAVVLGGIDLMGGKGHIIGVVLSILLLGTLLNGMGLANIDSTIQLLVFGSLLIGSVLIQRGAQWGRAYLRRRAAMSDAASP